MKKLFIFLLISVMCFSLVACGNKTENTNDNQNITSSSTEGTENKDNNSKENNNKITFTNSYKVPGKNIVVDVPSYQQIEKGFTQVYILHGVKYVAVTADKNSTATDLKSAHEAAFAKFKENIQNYSYVNSLKITKDSKETINSIEVYKYEGTVNCGRDTIYDAYVIGYSFIMDGVPCTITGSVIDQSQSQDMISEMRETVEEMIKTLRSER